MAGADPGPEEPAAVSTQPTLARASAVMSAGTALSRLTGFLRLAVMAWAIGGAESKLPDTYNLANSMPNIVYELLLGGVLSAVLLPVFVEHLATRAREEAWRLASTVLALVLLAAAALSAVAIVAAPWIIKLYTFRVAGADRAAQDRVGTFLLRLFLPQMIFYAAGTVLIGLLQAHRRFAAPMFAPVLNNLVVTATFVAFRVLHGPGAPDPATIPTGEKLVLGLGTTAGVVAMTLALLPAVRRLPGRRFRLRELEWRNPAIRKVGRLALFAIGYVVVNQVALWIVYSLANEVKGGVTAYQYSFILYQLPYGIFAVSVMTALLPSLAEHHIRGDQAAARRDLSLGLRTTAFIVLPAAAGFIALGRPIYRLLLEHGAFTARSTAFFADVFVLMVLGLAAFAAFQQIVRTFNAMQDTRTPFLVNTAAVCVNIGSAPPLFAALGVRGLALAHALSYCSGALVGGAILRRRLGGIDGRRLASAYARIRPASAATGLLAWAVAEAVGRRVDLTALSGRIAQVAPAVAAGLVAYLALARVLRVEEMGPLVAGVGGRLWRRGGG